MVIIKIKFENLVPNKYNPRKLFRGASMEELKESTKDFGLIEPLVVRQLENGKYEVVAGMRRYHALKDQKIEEVECNILDLTDTQAIDIAFIENIQRQDLTPIEEANMFLNRLKMNPKFLEEFEKYETVSDFFSKNLPSDVSKFTRELADTYHINAKIIANKLSLLCLPETLQNAIEIDELQLRIAYNIARLRQIEDNGLAQKSMLEIYNDYKIERDSISLDEIKMRVSKKIEYYKSKKDEQEEITEQRIQELKKKIKETKESKDAILKKLAKKIIEIHNNEAFTDIDFSEMEIIEPDNDEDLFEKNDRETIFSKGVKVSEFLEEEDKKYRGNEIYERIVENIDDLENKISDIRLLITRVKEKNITQCPFCYARIDLPEINKKTEEYQDELEDLKSQRSKIAGISGFISDRKKEINKIYSALESKDKFIEDFKKELGELKID